MKRWKLCRGWKSVTSFNVMGNSGAGSDRTRNPKHAPRSRRRSYRNISRERTADSSREFGWRVVHCSHHVCWLNRNVKATSDVSRPTREGLNRRPIWELSDERNRTVIADYRASAQPKTIDDQEKTNTNVIIRIRDKKNVRLCIAVEAWFVFCPASAPLMIISH